MRVAVLVMALLLTGCAGIRQDTAVRNYIDTTRPLAVNGSLKWSEYYERLYNLGAIHNMPGDSLARVNEAIRNAQQYEAGAITRDEFDYRMRALDATHRGAEQARMEQVRAQEAQLATAQMAAGLQLMQASQPHVLAPAVSTATAPVGLMGFLQSQSVNGFLRYCKYSNGVINTISSVSLCPLSTAQ